MKVLKILVGIACMAGVMLFGLKKYIRNILIARWQESWIS